MWLGTPQTRQKGREEKKKGEREKKEREGKKKREEERKRKEIFYIANGAPDRAGSRGGAPGR